MRALVGREAECKEVKELFAAVAGERSASLVFVGEPGVGKTALLRELQRQARERGFLILRARAGALERDFRFGVLRQLLEPLADGPGASAGRRLPADVAETLRRITGVPESGSGRLPLSMHEVTRLVAALCRTEPVLLSVDDLDEADDASLGWLTHLTEHIASLPLAIAGAMSPPDPSDTAIRDLLLRTRTVGLAGLDADAVGALVEEGLPAADSEALAPVCRQVTGGNPFLLLELLRSLRGSTAVTPDDVRRLGSSSAARALLARLHHVLPATVPLVRAVAVLGDGTDRAAAGALANLSERETENACRVLVRLGVLHGEHSLRFAHPMVPASLTAEMTVVGSGLAHSQAAELLHGRGAPSETVAAQLLHAAPVTAPWATQVLRTAAAEASRRGATSTTVTYLRRAVDVGSTVGLHIDLAMAEQEAGLPGADARLARLLSEAETPGLRTRVALALCRAVLLREGFEAATAVIDPVLDALAEQAPQEAADKSARVVAWALSLGTPPRLTRRWQALRSTVLPSGPRAAGLLAHHEAVSGGSPQRTVELARHALAGEPPAGHSEQAFFWTAVAALLAAGMVDEAEEHCARGLRSAQRYGWTMSEFVAHSHQARASLIRGRLGQAVRSAEAGCEALSRMRNLMPDGDGIGRAVGVLAESLVERGDLDAAGRLLDRHAFGDGHPLDRPEHYRLAYVRGRLRLARGDAAAALADLRTCGEHLGTGTAPAVTGLWRGYAALAHLRLGQANEAADLAVSEVASARRWGTPYVLGNALVIASVCLPDARRDLLEEAVALLDPSPCRHTLAAALTALGETFLPTDRAHGVELLYRGFELSTACEDITVESRSRLLLRSVGLRPRRPRTGAAALTGRERQILEFALRGLSNQEIADLHFLTRRTVEQHLSRGYRKLGITGRIELKEEML
ncbi:AAA family ATPase [Streptomyces sp. NPDC001787]|uniref:ATP-binding protein n=1 Tax=Streptomyces sp. NPDC001787 TaxID=3154523 RepID=UPI00331D8968